MAMDFVGGVIQIDHSSTAQKIQLIGKQTVVEHVSQLSRITSSREVQEYVKLARASYEGTYADKQKAIKVKLLQNDYVNLSFHTPDDALRQRVADLLLKEGWSNLGFLSYEDSGNHVHMMDTWGWNPGPVCYNNTTTKKWDFIRLLLYQTEGVGCNTNSTEYKPGLPCKAKALTVYFPSKQLLSLNFAEFFGGHRCCT